MIKERWWYVELQILMPSDLEEKEVRCCVEDKLNEGEFFNIADVTRIRLTSRLRKKK